LKTNPPQTEEKVHGAARVTQQMKPDMCGTQRRIEEGFWKATQTFIGSPKGGKVVSEPWKKEIENTRRGHIA